MLNMGMCRVQCPTLVRVGGNVHQTDAHVHGEIPVLALPFV